MWREGDRKAGYVVLQAALDGPGRAAALLTWELVGKGVSGRGPVHASPLSSPETRAWAGRASVPMWPAGGAGATRKLAHSPRAQTPHSHTHARTHHAHMHALTRPGPGQNQHGSEEDEDPRLGGSPSCPPWSWLPRLQAAGWRVSLPPRKGWAGKF